MRYHLNGLTDIYMVLSNERKIGGVIEAEYIRLRNGEQFARAVFVGVDRSGEAIYSLCFVTQDGKRIICHVDDIAMISEPVHKNICDLYNETYKRLKTAEKIKYLKKLLQVNEGSNNPLFKDEVNQLVADLGASAVESEVDISFLEETKNKTARPLSRVKIA